jgi:superfamily II DNA helicase RecQ
LSNRLQGIKPANLSFTQIKEKLVDKLKLSFAPDKWQLHLILRICQGYNSIFCVGTGYGKSLVFEGLAVLGGKGRVVIVISPLKALEHDQVCVFTSQSIRYANEIVLLG